MISRQKRIVILSPAIGRAGGADKATYLLAKNYALLGFKVDVFATSKELSISSDKISIHKPLFNKGYRWSIPQKLLILQLYVFSLLRPLYFIHGVGLTKEMLYALRILSNRKILLWETTEANPGNKFVCQKIFDRLENVHFMLAPSQTIAQNIRRNYSFTGEIRILPFWVEWSPDIQTKNRIRNSKILYVGRLDLDKGFDTLFDAIRNLKGQLNLELDICGRGDYKTLEKLAVDLPEVKIHRWVSDSELERYYSEADFLVLPSKHEGYPLSLLEACGKRIPVIATKVGSIPEVFSSSRAALLFNKDDADELADLLKTAYSENNDQYAIRSGEARMLFESLCASDKVQQSLSGVIKDLV